MNLIQMNEQINRIQNRYNTMDKPINQITAIKSLEQVRSYLQQKSQLNLAILMDKNNSTLLHFAAFKNDFARMKLFIKHYKQFTQLNHGTGLYKGESSFSDKLRAWVNSPNKQGYIPLLYAALHGNIPMIEFLQQCGSNMQFRTTKQENALFMCVQHNRIKALIFFIESNHNYSVNQKNINGDTVLHYACSKGYSQMVSYLLTVGADINARNNQDQTPLIVAVKQSKKQVVKMLLIKGANRADKNKSGQTALDIARQNHKQDLVRILDNNYSCMDKVRIKCNKKIVYEPQKQSYLYSLYFILLFHLFFLPLNILAEFSIDQKYAKYIPFLGEGIYEIIIIVLYTLLLRKPPRKRPQSLRGIDGAFCAECKRQTNDKTFHCYICQRCVYRYDHHCPWINNCVGAHNVGKFTLFLLFLILGLAEVITCCTLLILDTQNNIIRYRKGLQIPDQLHLPLNIVIIIFSTLLALGLFNLLVDQVRNLATNSTGFERQKREKGMLKKPELLASQASLNQSMTHDFDDQVEQKPCNCCGNCVAMLSDDN